MRFSFITAIATFSTTVLAQNLLGQIPACAQTCFGSNLGSCGPLDVACICGNSAVIDAVACCVFATCPSADINTTITFATTLCNTGGITLNTSPDCSSVSSSASASASASSSAASVASSASASASSSAASAASSAASAASSSGASATSSASSTASARSSASASAAATTGAAAPLQTAGAGLGLGMAVAGLLAFL